MENQSKFRELSLHGIGAYACVHFFEVPKYSNSHLLSNHIPLLFPWKVEAKYLIKIGIKLFFHQFKAHSNVNKGALVSSLLLGIMQSVELNQQWVPKTDTITVFFPSTVLHFLSLL